MAQRTVPFRIRFVDSFSGASVTLESTYLSFMDIDQGSDAGVSLAERVTVRGYPHPDRTARYTPCSCRLWCDEFMWYALPAC